MILAIPFDKYTKLLGKKIDFINWNINRKSLNPLSEIISIYQLIKSINLTNLIIPTILQLKLVFMYLSLRILIMSSMC